MYPPDVRIPPPLQLLHWVFRPVPFLDECRARYGADFTLRPLGRRFVVFSSPDAVRDIFTCAAEDVTAGEANFVLQAFLGPDSLLCLDGPRHLKERRLLSPPFHGERMQGWRHVMHEVTQKAVDRWPLDVPLDVMGEMQNITLRIILGSDDAELRVRLQHLLGLGARPWMVLLALLFNRRLFDIGIRERRIDIGSILPWVRAARLNREVQERLYWEITARRQAPGDDVLSQLLQTGEFTIPQLRSEMMTLLAAGHDTTATALTWAVYHVLHNRLQVDDVEAVIKETLRLTPVVPRRLQRPMRIGIWQLPAGTFVLPSMYLSQTREDVWGDARAFRPHRWHGRRESPYEFFPFGGGVRRCLGAAFAMQEMQIVLADVFSRVTLELMPCGPVRMVRRGVTLAPSQAIRVIARKRMAGGI